VAFSLLGYLDYRRAKIDRTKKKESSVMPRRAELLTGFGLGLGLVFLLDPQRGARRRAMLRDAAMRAMQSAGGAAETVARDMRNRAAGTAAELAARMRDDDADDRTVAERVRAKLGRVVSHPHAVRVTASKGIVTLTGPILQAEVPRLIHTVERVRGVRDVINQLDEHRHAAHIPSLQGGSVRSGMQADIFQRHWAPATRFIAAASGMSLAMLGAQRRGISGKLLIAGGLSLLARAGTNADPVMRTLFESVRVPQNAPRSQGSETS
jgi:osmotically-inducible protein OsmY